MDANKKAMLHNIRQALVVTLVLLLLCGFVFPVLLSGLSGLLFPHQAGGSLVTADGKAVGAKLVGQEFTEAYFMKGRPSAYHYNTYYTDEQGAGSTTTARIWRGWAPVPTITRPATLR